MHVIAVPDLEQSAAYYRQTLGFQIHEIGDPGWCLFTLGQCRIMAGHCPDATPPGETGDHSYFAYITLPQIDSYFDSVRKKGARILKELQDEPWGMREFAIQTGDGHRIMFGQELNPLR